MNQFNIKGISVIICCYNSKERLEPTLLHLAKQTSGNFKAEIVLVDNNSKDNTSLEASRLWNAFGAPFPMQILTEPKQGLSFARHTGVRTAKYEIVVFCDDDNWLAEDYLCKSFEIMNANNSITLMGGNGTPVCEVTPPDWFESCKGAYAVSDRFISSGLLPEDSFPVGAGMVLRKELFLEIFKDVPSLLNDRSGSELSSGGDTEICMRFKLLDQKLYYYNELNFKHFINKEKLTLAYKNKLYEGFKLGSEVLEYYNRLIKYRKSKLYYMLSISLKLVMKLPLTSLKLVKRWSLKRDLLDFYIVSGLDFAGLPVNWKKVRNQFY